ncbi:MAG TPA: DUF6508 domain-containing protein [Anaerolineales bacterium]|nr:DUF6508 domain-containing protein [Anaerolineales bacterium]
MKNTKKDHQPTLQDIEALTSFLPRLYAPGFSPVVKWEGGKNKDGTYTMPYPTYDPLVDEFSRAVSRRGWLDYEYNPEQAWKMIKDEHFIKTATLSQIKTMLTFCVRGERFSDGHWEQMIKEGHVRRLLERLNVIKSELQK